MLINFMWSDFITDIYKINIDNKRFILNIKKLFNIYILN